MKFGIIAAGEGSRLAAEGIGIPKPLVEICGRPMLGRLLRIMESCGAEEIVVCANSGMREVCDFLSCYRTPEGIGFHWSAAITPSSMHTFAEIASALDGNGRFILTTVDTVFRESDFRKYAEAWATAPVDVDVLMGVTGYVDDEKPLWVKTGNTPIAGSILPVEAFLDSNPDGVAPFVSGGIYGLNAKAVNVLRECIENGVTRMRNYQRALLAAGLNVGAWDMGEIMDIDHAGDIAAAEAFLREDP